MSASHNITPDRFDAVLFDLDGVLTATAKVHAVCWKETFDQFLEDRAAERNDPFRPFDVDSDYKLYVDGRPRYEGVSAFLESRGIRLPYGDPAQPPGSETICALGNRKDQLVSAVVESEGVEAYDDAVALVRELRKKGIKTAVVSSSHHCRAVLVAAGIADLFDVRIDGEVADGLKLKGKPAPDTFLEAAKDLGVEPARTVVVEDAISGVQAGRNGGFGLVVGIDRKDDPDSLRQNGAHVVVTNLSDLAP